MAASKKTLKGINALWKFKTSLAIALALIGAAIYLSASINFARNQRATIDEGLYLYKGYLFAKGIYHPYQNFGPRTEYSPLSYLIPGYVQLWFGPGLRTGRTFAIILGLGALAGLWSTTRRLAGTRWAAAAVWAVTLNPAIIQFYSFGISQGLVTCLLVWMCFFTLDENRSILQAVISAVLGTLIVLSRQNMAPVLPILLVFIFWQFGKKAGLISLLTSMVVFFTGQVGFWPGILVVWAPWIPSRLTPFLNRWRIPSGLTPALDFYPGKMTRLYTSLEGLRYHFVAVAGSIMAILLWPRHKAWKNERIFRFSLFMATLFFVLLVLHVWAGLGLSGINFGNAYTVNPYLAFFSFLGILLTLAVLSNFRMKLSVARQVIISGLVVVISGAIGYGSYLITGDFFAHVRIPRLVSFLKTGKFLPGVPIWDYLHTAYGVPYNISIRLIPLAAGLICGVAILLASLGIRSYLKRKRVFHRISFGAVTAVVFLVVGFLMSPSVALGGGFTQWECSMNVIQTYEQTGQYVASALSPGDQVYWDGGNAVALLLYVPDTNLFPQQLDDQWNHFNNGNSETLARLGLWNDALANQWRDEAKVFMIQQVDYPKWQAYLDTPEFEELQMPDKPLNCEADTNLRVFIRRTNPVITLR